MFLMIDGLYSFELDTGDIDANDAGRYTSMLNEAKRMDGGKRFVGRSEAAMMI